MDKFSCPDCSQSYDVTGMDLPLKIQCSCGLRVRFEENGDITNLDEQKATAEPVESNAVEPNIAKKEPQKKEQEIPLNSSAQKKKSSLLPLVVVILLLGGGAAFFMMKANQNREPDNQVSNNSEEPKKLVIDQQPAAKQSPNSFSDFVEGENVEPKVSFDLDQWKKTYVNPSEFKFETWPRPYAGGPGFSWFEPKSVDCANRYYTYMGPLGVQAIAINAFWQKHPGFDQFFPEALKDTDGRIFCNAFLVTKVFEGSPAAGRLQEGDLIYEVDDNRLVDAMHIDPGVNFMTKNVRSLNYQLGWLIDRAEGRGEISMRVIRGIMDIKYFKHFESNKLKNSSQKIEVELSGKNFLKLKALKTGGNNSYCWANWVRPQLTGEGKKPIDLSTVKWMSATAGWGRVRQGKDINNKDFTFEGKIETKVLGTHADSEIVFVIPEGYTKFSAVLHAPKNEIQGVVEAGRRPLMAKVKRQWQNILHQKIELSKDADGPSMSAKTVKQHSFSFSVKGKKYLKLSARGDKTHHYGWSNWLNPQFTGKKTIELSKEEWLAGTTGWGRIRRGFDLNNKEVVKDGQRVTNMIGTHADSVLIFEIPEGADKFSTDFEIANGGASVIPSASATAGADYDFDLALPECERFSIEMSGGSGILMNAQLQNERGEIFELHPVKESKSRYKNKILSLSPSKTEASVTECSVPPGKWTVKGNLFITKGSPQLKVSVLKSVKLPADFKKFTQKVSFEIPQIGSFARGFPNENCKKSELISQMTAAWIAVQQNPDGSWPRRAGYCSPAFDTAICMMALLSTGDDQYKKHLKRGAHYLMYASRYSDWSCPNGMALTAICEYFLRYKDSDVLPGIEMLVTRCKKFIYGDYTAGHGANPGYGDGGVNYGGSHIALGLALAEKTPVGTDGKMLDGLLWRVQQMSPNGYVPYGRSGRGFDTPPGGYAAGARGGPYLVAARLHGGPKHFIDTATKHYTERTLGGGDQGHSTKIFSFFGSTIGIACSDDEAYKEHARRYGWAVTLARRYKGGFIWSAELLEYMGAESVMHDLYRASSYVVFLNAWKKNMAITGQKKYFPSKQYEIPKLTDWDRRVWSYYRSNWLAVSEIMGDKAPSELTQTLRQFEKMIKSEGELMNSLLFELVEKNAPFIIKAIDSESSLNQKMKDYLVEMVLGVDHKVEFIVNKDSGSVKCKLSSLHPFAAKLEKAAHDSVVKHKTSLKYPMSGKIILNNVSGDLLKKPLELDVDSFSRVVWSKGMTSSEFDLVVPAKDEKFSLKADFEFKIGDRSFKYSRNIVYPEDKRNNRYVWIKGKTSRDHLRHSFAFKTERGYMMETVNSTSQKLPVDFEGRELYSDVKATYPLVEGGTAEFAYQSDLWRVVPATVIRARNPVSPEVKISSMKVDGSPVDVGLVNDWEEGTQIDLKLVPDQKSVIDITLNSEVSINRIFALMEGRRFSVVLKAKTGSEWMTVHENFDSGKLQQLLALKAKEFKLEVVSKQKSAALKELHFYKTSAYDKSL